MSLDVVMTTSGAECVFLELAGMQSNGSRFLFPNTLTKSTPILFELYLVNRERTIKLSPCFMEGVDISFSKLSALTLSANISAAGFEDVTGIPYNSGRVEISPVPPTYIKTEICGIESNNVTSATVSLQQDCSWRDDKSLFFNGDFYTPSKAVLTDIELNSTIQLNLDVHNNISEPVDSDLLLGKSGLYLNIENARIFPRDTVSSIYTTSLDVTLSENTGDAFFTFGEKI